MKWLLCCVSLLSSNGLPRMAYLPTARTILVLVIAPVVPRRLLPHNLTLSHVLRTLTLPRLLALLLLPALQLAPLAHALAPPKLAVPHRKPPMLALKQPISGRS